MSDIKNYSVILLRKDGNHIFLDIGDIEKTYTKWASYRDQWTTCLHEKKPLVVIEKDLGIVTAFDPGIVTEIIIREKTLKVDNNNPYKREMQEKGFSQTFSNYTGNSSDLLDRGYKI